MIKLSPAEIALMKFAYKIYQAEKRWPSSEDFSRQSQAVTDVAKRLQFLGLAEVAINNAFDLSTPEVARLALTAKGIEYLTNK